MLECECFHVWLPGSGAEECLFSREVMVFGLAVERGCYDVCI